MQFNGCLLGKVSSLLQSPNRIFGIQLVRWVIFFNHIPLGLHLLSILLHYFGTTFIYFHLTVSGIPFLFESSDVVFCVCFF